MLPDIMHTCHKECLPLHEAWLFGTLAACVPAHSQACSWLMPCKPRRPDLHGCHEKISAHGLQMDWPVCWYVHAQCGVTGRLELCQMACHCCCLHLTELTVSTCHLRWSQLLCGPHKSDADCCADVLIFLDIFSSLFERPTRTDTVSQMHNRSKQSSNSSIVSWNAKYSHKHMIAITSTSLCLIRSILRSSCCSARPCAELRQLLFCNMLSGCSSQGVRRQREGVEATSALKCPAAVDSRVPTRFSRLCGMPRERDSCAPNSDTTC